MTLLYTLSFLWQPPEPEPDYSVAPQVGLDNIDSDFVDGVGPYQRRPPAVPRLTEFIEYALAHL